MSDNQALILTESSKIGNLHYLCYRPAPAYNDKVEFTVQVAYTETRLMPAFVRQAARNVAAAILAIADEMERAPLGGLKE